MRSVEDQNNWLDQTLSKLPNGLKLLDAGAREQKNWKFCKHLNYISQEIWRIKSVTEKYSGKVPSLFNKIEMVLILKMLARLSKNDKVSSEILCYCYHVIAKKL